jgi:hypothetical protein
MRRAFDRERCGTSPVVLYGSERGDCPKGRSSRDPFALASRNPATATRRDARADAGNDQSFVSPLGSGNGFADAVRYINDGAEVLAEIRGQWRLRHAERAQVLAIAVFSRLSRTCPFLRCSDRSLASLRIASARSSRWSLQ